MPSGRRARRPDDGRPAEDGRWVPDDERGRQRVDRMDAAKRAMRLAHRSDRPIEAAAGDGRDPAHRAARQFAALTHSVDPDEISPTDIAAVLEHQRQSLGHDDDSSATRDQRPQRTPHRRTRRGHRRQLRGDQRPQLRGRRRRRLRGLRRRPLRLARGHLRHNRRRARRSPPRTRPRGRTGAVDGLETALRAAPTGLRHRSGRAAPPGAAQQRRHRQRRAASPTPTPTTDSSSRPGCSDCWVSAAARCRRFGRRAPVRGEPEHRFQCRLGWPELG